MELELELELSRTAEGTLQPGGVAGEHDVGDSWEPGCACADGGAV
jgi:hypothetical protein